MRLASLFSADGRPVLAGRGPAGDLLDLSAADPSLGTDVGALLGGGPEALDHARSALERARPVGASPRYRPVIPRPGKLLCLGLNDRDHAAEGGFPVPEYPAVFARVATSLIGHGAPMWRPRESEQLDYEVELAVVIGHAARRLTPDEALAHVAGYTVFNDGTIRNYQRKTPQWTIGKNWHATGALGPELVTSDELPTGAVGLELATWVGDERLQDGNTARMVFSVAETVALMSEVMLLEPGDVIAMGTVRGVGHARKPPRWLRPGETVRASIEGIGEIANPIEDDPGQRIVRAGASERPSSEGPSAHRAS